jgi:hypothetical protein
MELFPGTAKPPDQSDKIERHSQSVTTIRPTNINVVPIDYAFRPRLRANPAQINFKQEPLVFRRGGLSPPLSLLMSAFALPIPPAVLTDLPSSAYGTLRYRLTLTDQTQSFGAWL